LFNLEEKVFLKTLKFKGVIKEKEDHKYKVTFFNQDSERNTEWFEETDLVGWRVSKPKQSLTIKVKYHADISKIEQISIGNWIDLRSAEDVEMKQFDFKLISLGVSMQLPKGYEAEVKPRSSTFKNFGILQTNSVGCIDETFCGNEDIWKLPALAMRDMKINKDDRICQFRINRIMPDINFETVDDLGNENRKGFGHTGIK
jgi:dUTP pyrophosphatase